MSDGRDVVDINYLHLPCDKMELEHAYGPHIHILNDAFLLTHLAFLCAETTKQPAINTLVHDLYQYLIKAVLNGEFPRKVQTIKTRMAAFSEHGYWTGELIDHETRAITVNVLRAGSLPSQVCFDYLNKTLEPSLVRQDHVVMSRVTDVQGHVIGSHLGDSKIGGDVDNAIVLFPDPMGATGGSLSQVIHYYKENIPGKAKKYVAVNLIVTPEYLKRMTEDHPDVVIYALRIDRGASSSKVLKEKPGVYWDEESGLTDKQYIIPGGGGFGEIMNNAYC